MGQYACGTEKTRLHNGSSRPWGAIHRQRPDHGLSRIFAGSDEARGGSSQARSAGRNRRPTSRFHSLQKFIPTDTRPGRRYTRYAAALRMDGREEEIEIADPGPRSFAHKVAIKRSSPPQLRRGVFCQRLTLCAKPGPRSVALVGRVNVPNFLKVNFRALD